jgi:hypothetical protein
LNGQDCRAWAASGQLFDALAGAMPSRAAVSVYLFQRIIFAADPFQFLVAVDFSSWHRRSVSVE